MPAELPAHLAELAARVRPQALANEELLPLDSALAELLGTPGLRRGTTVVVDAGAACGSTTLALALLADASAAGAWTAAVDLPRLGLLAAGEIGLALERVVVVPDSGARFGTVVGALLDACDLVLVGSGGHLDPVLARRLVTRARERRSVLVVVTSASGPSAAAWGEGVDVRLGVSASRSAGLGWEGLGEGCGYLSARQVEVTARRRRAVPQVLRLRLWLPSPEGAVAIAASTVSDRAPRARRQRAVTVHC